MKVTKRLLAILLSMCLIVSMFSMTALAEGEKGSITIQNPSDSQATVAGKSFNVYKIFDASTDGTNTSYSWYEQSAGYVPFYDFFYGSVNPYMEQTISDGTGNVQAVVEKISNFNDNLLFSQFAESLHDYINSENTDGDEYIISPIRTVTADSTATSVTISELDYGYYLVYDNSDLGDTAVRSAVMLTTVDKDKVITLKANRPHIEKYVLENNGSYGKGTSSSIGDKATFKIETIVPSHKLYTQYAYYIEDKLPTGLTLDADSIKVYRNDESNALDNTGNKWYQLTIEKTSEYDFKIVFYVTNKTEDIPTGHFIIGDKITVVYDTNVTNAIGSVNTNTVTLKYSNDPTVPTSEGSLTSTANVYSYQMILSKFAEDSKGVLMNLRLAGAEFNLYRVETGKKDKLIKFTQQQIIYTDDNNENHTFTKYIVAADGTEGANEKLEVHATGDKTILLDHINYGGHLGDVVIFGLSEGTYKLVETKAPDGYVLPSTPFIIDIQDTIGQLGSVSKLELVATHSESDAGHIANVNGIAESILTVWAEITNKPGSVLPETGGIGSTIYMVAGLAIMVSAAAVLVYKKRNSAK